MNVPVYCVYLPSVVVTQPTEQTFHNHDDTWAVSADDIWPPPATLASPTTSTAQSPSPGLNAPLVRFSLLVFVAFDPPVTHSTGPYRTQPDSRNRKSSLALKSQARCRTIRSSVHRQTAATRSRSPAKTKSKSKSRSRSMGPPGRLKRAKYVAATRPSPCLWARRPPPKFNNSPIRPWPRRSRPRRPPTI
ncbi:hypothetical protein BCR44DRAFT_1049199 [Catenaria anguillulae PL171]|uniref:Uncharacterized protein n=1 Tax=Catenaria anguillulae PL171 TaxID=765915 RepID=A0A1Y2HQQ8_9FUNG|nr:hypothetical protein BCR44DRAFT_1049199 [Catenaria anguillulae PL171]